MVPASRRRTETAGIGLPLLRMAYAEIEITAEPTQVTDLPAGTINHHWTKGLIANADGSKLYVSVGSNSNAAENGIENEKARAAIWEVATK